jgi:hypothetical protein
MGNIRLLHKEDKITITLTPEEVLAERFPTWPEAGEGSFAILLNRLALRKLGQVRPGFDPRDVRSIAVSYEAPHYCITLKLQGDWHAKIQNLTRTNPV